MSAPCGVSRSRSAVYALATERSQSACCTSGAAGQGECNVERAFPLIKEAANDEKYRMAAHEITMVEVGSLTLGARRAGNPDHNALILLHGWPHCSALYEDVLDELAVDRFVLAFDLPAIGASLGAPFSAEKIVLADLVLQGAEKLGAKSIVMAGLDVGGMTAFAAARDHGKRIKGAVVMNTVIPGIDPWSELLADPHIWHFAFHDIPELPETMVAGRERPYFDFFIQALAGNANAVSQDMRAAFVAAYARPEALKAGFDWYRAFKQDAKRNARPKAIRTPMLYVRGKADGRHIDDYVQGLKAAGASNLTHQTIPGGEFSPLEAPSAFVSTLRSFCRRCDRS